MVGDAECELAAKWPVLLKRDLGSKRRDAPSVGLSSLLKNGFQHAAQRGELLAVR